MQVLKVRDLPRLPIQAEISLFLQKVKEAQVTQLAFPGALAPHSMCGPSARKVPRTAALLAMCARRQGHSVATGTWKQDLSERREIRVKPARLPLPSQTTALTQGRQPMSRLQLGSGPSTRVGPLVLSAPVLCAWLNNNSKGVHIPTPEPVKRFSHMAGEA